MDMELENNLGESSQSSTFVYTHHSLAVNNSTLHMPTCTLCHRIITSDNDGGDISSNVCGDCKFLLLEDIEPTSPDVYPRLTRVARRRFDSSESMESMFSQQFSQIINLARQNPSAVSERDSNSVDGDGAARLERHISYRSTSRRRGFSDSESDAFDSLYGESESNASLRRDMAAHSGEADTISYGGDSDASVDDQSFLENENFGHLNGGSELDSDTDIDPMNAGLYQLNSEDDSDWEMEADIEGNALESLMGGGTQSHGSLTSNGSSAYVNWRRHSLSPSVEHAFPLRRRERMTNLQEVARNNRDEDYGAYLDARGFGVLLDHLAETESSRRGAPPASVSFVNNMPCMTINNDDKMVEGVTCAICKDPFIVGTVVNTLPCSHFYHPSCILPWLSARNTCPLCRYELPTDDKDYEARKRNLSNENQTFQINQPAFNDEPSQVNHGDQQRELVDADSAARENSTRDITRNRWFFLAAAAAPVVSLVGISLILWFGNPASGRLYRNGRLPYRRETSPRRWWPFF